MARERGPGNDNDDDDNDDNDDDDDDDQEWSRPEPGHHELLVTGHADGSVRFWETTGSDMKHLYRLRTQKLFEKNKEKSSTGEVDLEDDPYSITNIAMSADTRVLVVTGSTDQVSASL